MADNTKVLALEPTASGGVFVAPLGSAAPTDARTALDAAFVDLGGVGEDGVTEQTDRNIEKKRNWGGKVVKTLQTEYSKIFTWVFLESTNADVLRAIHHSSNVSETAANSSHGNILHVKHNVKRPQKLSWVFDSYDSELDAMYRTYVPIGQVLTTGDVKRVHTDTIEYEVELEAFEDENGDLSLDWLDDGQLVTPVPPNWQATTVYAVGDYAKLVSGNKELRCVSAGTSGSSAPTAPGLGGYVADGTVIWQQISA
ncbi:MAG TPA: hypothetical protein PLB92_00405 [Rhodoglobus sp.]|nr:hypothetical protein [Rhodoglobus sp.]